ncbi:lipocalin-like domain-containing protein [Mycobacterium sp. AZCC_0083]|uniref:lipocalin-like domain-containing protein n=1 Tax=Mycobacterium sp. AZCC_0083 TaxID=2735882 RepID=UPI001621D823|nr:lipocalin-like domain-containing protein [Mycobacterium sp. AZCC_0083]
MIEMLMERLVGGWRLDAVIGTHDDGNTFYPMGSSVQGRIVYTPAGLVAVNLMEGDRELPEAGTRWPRVAEADAALWARTYMAYSGRYSVDEQSQIVHHHLDMCLDPTMVDTDQVRHVEFAADGELKLGVPLDEFNGQPIQSIVLVWHRETD